MFVTSHSEPEFEVACFEAGAVDYVQKPVQAPVLLARVQTHIRLKRLSDKLRHSASIDPLTDVANRRVFDEMLDHEWRRAQRNSQPLSLMLIDIDHFKAFNDHYGHPAGDDCLRTFAETLRKIAARAPDAGVNTCLPARVCASASSPSTRKPRPSLDATSSFRPGR